MKLTTRRRRRHRYANEFGTAVTSIRNHCLECCGYEQAEVDRCTAPACWLYPWRFGMGPARAGAGGKTVDFTPETHSEAVRRSPGHTDTPIDCGARYGAQR